jgi:drug/metabolite transporter (DMT)-like permease
MFSYLAVPILCRIVVNDLLLTLVVKRSIRTQATSRSLVWQYLFGFALVCFSLPWVSVGMPDYLSCLCIVAIGAGGAFALFAMWKVMAVSIGVSSLCGPLPALVAIVLGFIFLDESRHIRSYAMLVAGLIFCVLAALMLGRKGKQNGHKKSAIIRLLPWVLLVGVIRGGVGFALRFYRDVPTTSYVFLGYFGALLAAVLIFVFCGKQIRGNPLDIDQKKLLLALAGLYVLNLWINKWLHAVAPLSLVQPILLVSGTVLPLLIGYFCYGDRGLLGRRALLAICLGVVGMLFVVIAVH